MANHSCTCFHAFFHGCAHYIGKLYALNVLPQCLIHHGLIAAPGSCRPCAKHRQHITIHTHGNSGFPEYSACNRTNAGTSETGLAFVKSYSLRISLLLLLGGCTYTNAASLAACSITSSGTPCFFNACTSLAAGPNA